MANKRKSLNSQPQGYELKQESKPMGTFVSTGVPGMGFYIRFKDTPQQATPLLYSSKYQTTKTVMVTREKPSVAKKYASDKEGGEGCLALLVAIVAIIYFIGSNASSFFLNHIWATILVVLVVICVCIYFFFKDKEEKVPETRYQYDPVPDADIPEVMRDKALAIAETSDNKTTRQILECFADSVSPNPKGMLFKADADMNSAQKREYRNFCVTFENLLLCNYIRQEDFSQASETDDSVLEFSALSDASLYVGAFLNIQTNIATPVVDFGDFQLYIYPHFVIKAYDAYTFQVVDIRDLSISHKAVNYSNKQLHRLTFSLLGVDYAILVDDFIQSQNLCFFFDKYKKTL